MIDWLKRFATNRDSARRHRRLIPRPEVLTRFESEVAARIPIHPNLISSVKLVVITPLILLTLDQVDLIAGGAFVAVGLFVPFALLDYLDGVVARGRNLTSPFGRVFDRLTDYPLLIGVSWFCLDILPTTLLLTKLGLDLLLLLLFLLGRGSTANRLRTTVSYATLLALLCFSQGWLPGPVGAGAVQGLLWLNILFSTVVVLHNLDILHRRRVADLLSTGNLVSGLFSIRCALAGRFELSLLFLLVGATFDGLDGAAARRWGGSRLGVLADDIADGVSYGIAPAVALGVAVGGPMGVVLGIIYALFTITRLVFFTLNKATADPDAFAGAPSTIGAVITLTGLILFAEQPVAMGFVVGIGCAQMVSFSAPFCHPLRFLRTHPQLLLAAPLPLGVGVAGYLVGGPAGPAILLLAGCLTYALWPPLATFCLRARHAESNSVGLRGGPH